MSLWRENSSRDLRTELCTRVLELCSRLESWHRGADRVCRLSVLSSKFLLKLMPMNSLSVRTEYRIQKYEHVKKYTFKGVKN